MDARVTLRIQHREQTHRHALVNSDSEVAGNSSDARVVWADLTALLVRRRRRPLIVLRNALAFCVSIATPVADTVGGSGGGSNSTALALGCQLWHGGAVLLRLG